MNKLMINDIIYFAKVREGAIIPSKKHEDGCYDVYACFDEESVIIKPGEVKMIPTGIASACTPKYRFGIRERGSTGIKCMSKRAGQIDSGYRGEWFIPINNTGNKTIVITKNSELQSSPDIIIYPYGKAIAQVALEEVPNVDVQEMPYSDLILIESERGTGKLGDSGK